MFYIDIIFMAVKHIFPANSHYFNARLNIFLIYSYNVFYDNYLFIFIFLIYIYTLSLKYT